MFFKNHKTQAPFSSLCRPSRSQIPAPCGQHFACVSLRISELRAYVPDLDLSLDSGLLCRLCTWKIRTGSLRRPPSTAACPPPPILPVCSVFSLKARLAHRRTRIALPSSCSHLLFPQLVKLLYLFP